MKLEDAYIKFKSIENKPFSELFTRNELNYIKINKGKTGQLLEYALGIGTSSTILDFEDGELKSNKCDKNGNPIETIGITQIATYIDDLLMKKHFQEMPVYEKIRNLLYVPVAKEGPPEEWMFLPCVHIDLENPRFIGIRKQLEDDYYTICDGLISQVENSPYIIMHAVNGKYMQMRCKDFRKNGTYSPIYSELYGRYVTHKNQAFYFKRQFIKTIMQDYTV